jgi:hypothetical protein
MPFRFLSNLLGHNLVTGGYNSIFNVFDMHEKRVSSVSINRTTPRRRLSPFSRGRKSSGSGSVNVDDPQFVKRAQVKEYM